MTKFTLELSEIEARGLLSMLETAQDVPLSIGGMRQRLLALSEHSEHCFKTPNKHAETVDGPLRKHGK